MKGALVCAIAVAVVAPWTTPSVVTTASKPHAHEADMMRYHSSKLLTTFVHLPEVVRWELETISDSLKHNEHDDVDKDEEKDKKDEDKEVEEDKREAEKEKKEAEIEAEKEKKDGEKEAEKEKKEVEKEKRHVLRVHHHYHHASEPWDSSSFHPTHFVHTLQEDTESFIADVMDWVHDLVGDVNGSKLNVDTQFTLTTKGHNYHPCGDLVAHKTFPVLERFLDAPADAELTPYRVDKILWTPSRHCLGHHHSLEVDGGAHAEFEVSCGVQVLLNASVASGGVTRNVFGHNIEASGALVSVDFLNGTIKAIGASGPLGSLVKYRDIPEDSEDILKKWAHTVRECAEKQELSVRGVVGGGWRQKYAAWGARSDESVVGYAEAFEITYERTDDVPVAETEAPVAETEAPAAETEAPGTETEAPGAETEAPATETEAPIAESEAPIAETEAPVGETEAPAAEPEPPSTEKTEAPVEDTESPAVEIEVPVEETEAPAAETEAPVAETEAPVEETLAPSAETQAPVVETEAPAAETEAPVEETETPAAETEAPVAETEAPVEETEAPVTGTEAPLETEAPAAEFQPPVDETEIPVNEVEAPATETESPTLTTDGDVSTTPVNEDDVSTAAQQQVQKPASDLPYSEEPAYYDENAPEPQVPADLASAKLKKLSEATSAMYVHSGMQCRTQMSTSNACFMNTALAKVGHGAFADMTLAVTRKHDQDSPSPNVSLPLFGMLAIVCIGVFATFRTANRRQGYQPIGSVA